VEGNFEVIAKSERIYRHVGRARAGELGRILAATDGTRLLMRPEPGQPPSRDAAYAELCRRMVLETYAPAAILITRGYEQRYALGPIDRYLRVASGAPTHDLLAMARPGLRTRIRAAVHAATESGARVVVAGGRGGTEGGAGRFSIAVHPVQSEGEALLLLCFLDEPRPETLPRRALAPGESQRIADLEQELAATGVELQGAIRNLEVSAEDQRIAHEEALSINEEFQSTNEELLTSKEELQSLNEELTALNAQLQETLERQRTTSADLQNILYSTDVATLFLDPALNIRFFTPATRALFHILPGDVGRPLRDLASLATDHALGADARAVLAGAAAIEREVETDTGTWFVRRVQPYRGKDDVIEGVVLTFTDTTERKRISEISRDARQQAELANIAKSRFLAAASHDLRQPLQSIALVQGLLAQTVQGERARALVARLDETLGAMAGMLNTLLDINQLEVGAVQPEIVAVPVNAVFEPLKEEFVYHAEARGLALRVVPCGLTIATDARLLSQMIRNLLSNAVKYTERGKLLLGCRRHGGTLSIEVWDTGTGIPGAELDNIFEEYHQLGNPARERGRGLGLGLAIVRRLGDLLGHRVSVRSRPGRGSVFAIEVALAPKPEQSAAALGIDDPESAGDPVPHLGAILVVEDDPEVSDLLSLLLEGAGHHVTRAAESGAALDLVRHGGARPDLIIADYNLPGGMNGLQLTAALRKALGRQIAALLLTGDISVDTGRDLARAECVRLYKPVKVPQLMQAIQLLLPPAPAAPAPRAPVAPGAVVIYVVDDDKHICNEIRAVLEAEGRAVEDYASGEAFLAAYRPEREACLLLDAYLPGMSGLEVLDRLREIAAPVPAIVITGRGDVAMAVQAMKAGARDFSEKPISRVDLISGIARALDHARDRNARGAWRAAATSHISRLTRRQREIMERVLAGQPNKNIADDLGISQRTVENHRAQVMKRTGAGSLPALARLAMAAVDDEPAPET
jgi:two-component system CheB/CheR fusion protein